MTIANDIIFLSLKNSGVVGVGQVPLSEDVNDSFRILNAMIGQWNIARGVTVNLRVLPNFPNLTTDVPFWSPYEHILLTTLAVRLREIYSLPPVELDVKLAMAALETFNAINLQQTAAPTIAADDGTGYGIIYLALRAAGRVNDKQGVTPTSQDVTDAASLMREMLDEWQRMRTVRVISGTLPLITDLSLPLVLEPGLRNAIVLNLAVRLRDAFGAEVPKTLVDRAAMALEVVQAINLQQIPPILPGVPATAQQVLVLALRMAGRITDTQSIAPGSADMNDAFSLLVAMIAQWRRYQWLAWVNAELIIPSTGAQSYAMLDRPPRLASAFARLLVGQRYAGINNAGPMDYPLQIISSQAEYNAISLKQLGTFPAAVWYQPDYPAPALYFWPIPPAGQFNLHVFYPSPLPTYTDPTDPLGLPPEYTSALVANLAVQLVELNGKDPPRSLKMRAASTLDTVRCSNARVSSLAVPVPGMPSQGSGGISGMVGPHQSVIVLDTGLPVLG